MNLEPDTMGAQYLLCFTLLSTFYLHIELRVCSLTLNNRAPQGLKISQTFSFNHICYS
jgi:hypothetical protein